jgi:carbamoyl-phosphate synthase small subunit
MNKQKNSGEPAVSLLPSITPAILALADGTVFKGQSIGADGVTSGEVVFNTAMSGYQEILTDPSYCRQIVTLTYPHIGNTGCNAEDFESPANYAAGLVIRDLPRVASNWRCQDDLSSYLKKHGIVAIAGIDTRKLTRILREKGAQSGCILAGEVDEAKALAMARAFPGLAGMDLAKVVSAKEKSVWSEGEWTLKGYASGPAPRPEGSPLAFPCGGLRFWCQAQYPAHAGPAWRQADRRAGTNAGGRCAGDESGWHFPVQWPGRSGAL